MTEDINATQYWQMRTLEHLSEMRLAKRAGLFPKVDGWRNVVEHELVEMEVSDVLAEVLRLPPVDRSNLQQATLLHDVWKRHQIEMIRTAAPENKETVQDETFHQQQEFLFENDVSNEVVRLTTCVGHKSLGQFVKNPTTNPFELKDDLSLPMLIIHYADDIMDGNNFGSLDKRIDKLENRKHPYPEAGKGGDIFEGRTYYQAQREIGHLVEGQIVARIVESDAVSQADKERLSQNPDQLPTFIREQISARIQSFSNSSG